MLASISIAGIDRFDQRELADVLPPGSVRFERGESSGGRHGELLTATAIVVISVEAIRALAAWLQRTRNTRVVEQTVVVEHADGRRETRTLKVDLSSSEAPTDDVLRSLSDLLAVDDLPPGGGR